MEDRVGGDQDLPAVHQVVALDPRERPGWVGTGRENQGDGVHRRSPGEDGREGSGDHLPVPHLCREPLDPLHHGRDLCLGRGGALPVIDRDGPRLGHGPDAGEDRDSDPVQVRGVRNACDPGRREPGLDPGQRLLGGHGPLGFVRVGLLHGNELHGPLRGISTLL